MNKRIGAALCVAVMTAGLVPYQAFADEAQPQAESHSFDLILNVTDDNGDGWLTPGEKAHVSVSLGNMAWADSKNGVKLFSINFIADFDSGVYEALPATDDGFINSSAYTLNEKYSSFGFAQLGKPVGAEDSSVSFMIADFTGGKALNFTDAPEELVAWDLTMKQAPAEMARQLTFAFDTDGLEFSFKKGTADVPATPNIIVNSDLKVDTVKPGIETENDKSTFYYQPITVKVTDADSGLASVTLNGQPVTLEADGTTALTSGGELVAVDNCGNRASVTLTIDADAYNAALDAKIPAAGTVRYGDIDQIKAAEDALNAVSDADAKAKLAEKSAAVAAARQEWTAIDDEIKSVESSIEGLPDPKKAGAKDVAAVNAIDSKLKELAAKDVTESNIPNIQKLKNVKEAIEAVQKRVNTVKDEIAALPETVNFENKASVETVCSHVDALLKDYPNDDLLTKDELAKVESARAAAAGLDKARQELVDEIAAFSWTPSLKEDELKKVQDLRDKVDAMKGANFTESELRNLTDAEKASDDVLEVKDNAEKSVAALPEASDVRYGDIDTIKAASQLVRSVEDLGGSVDTAKLTDAENAWKQIDSDRAAADDLMAKLPAVAENVTLANREAAIQARKAVKNLVAKGVQDSDYKNINNLNITETRITEIGKQVEAVQEQINALDASKVTYQDETVAAVDKAVQELKTLAAQFDETKLNDAKAAVKDIEDTKIPTGNEAVKNFMAKAVDPSDPAYITEANDVNDQVDTLVNDLKVPTDQIEQYKEFKERYTPLEEQSQKIKAVESKIDGAVKGITEDTVKFSDKKALDEAQAALNALVNEDKLDVPAAYRQKLTDAYNALEKLQAQKEQLIKKINDELKDFTATLTNSKTVTDLQDAVKNMEDKRDADFTTTDDGADEAMKLLNKALNSLGVVKKQSEELHNRIANLPEKEQVTAADKNELDTVKNDMVAMAKLGDIFSEAENAKVEAVEVALNAQAARMQALADKMAAQNSDVKYADKTVKREIEEEIAALQKLGYTIDQSSINKLNTNAWNGYTSLQNGLAAMDKKISELNAGMDELLSKWGYPYDAQPFDAQRDKMDQAMADYAIPADKKTEVFPNYGKDQKQSAAAEKALAQIEVEMKALPAKPTLSTRANLNQIAADIDALRKAPYSMTKEAIKGAVGAEVYSVYENTIEKVAELERLDAVANGKATAIVDELLSLPDSLKVKYASLDTLKSSMADQLIAQNKDIGKNIKFFDVNLQIEPINGTLHQASADEYKAYTDKHGFVHVVLPYPANTKSDDTFFVVHAISNGSNVGTIEVIRAVATTAGIEFDTDSLSPFALGWVVTPSEAENTANDNQQTATNASQQEEDSKYYTCPKCGYHDWTGCEGGYKCNHCGSIVTKEISKYRNVKGVATNVTKTDSKTKNKAVIPQTADMLPLKTLLALVVLSLSGMLVVLYIKKRKNESEGY